jgi:hypothetical protein
MGMARALVVRLRGSRVLESEPRIAAARQILRACVDQRYTETRSPMNSCDHTRFIAGMVTRTQPWLAAEVGTEVDPCRAEPR